MAAYLKHTLWRPHADTLPQVGQSPALQLGILMLEKVGFSEGSADGRSSYTACNDRPGSKDLPELGQKPLEICRSLLIDNLQNSWRLYRVVFSPGCLKSYCPMLLGVMLANSDVQWKKLKEKKKSVTPFLCSIKAELHLTATVCLVWVAHTWQFER